MANLLSQQPFIYGMGLNNVQPQPFSNVVDSDELRKRCAAGLSSQPPSNVKERGAFIYGMGLKDVPQQPFSNVVDSDELRKRCAAGLSPQPPSNVKERGAFIYGMGLKDVPQQPFLNVVDTFAELRKRGAAAPAELAQGYRPTYAGVSPQQIGASSQVAQMGQWDSSEPQRAKEQRTSIEASSEAAASEMGQWDFSESESSESPHAKEQRIMAELLQRYFVTHMKTMFFRSRTLSHSDSGSDAPTDGHAAAAHGMTNEELAAHMEAAAQVSRDLNILSQSRVQKMDSDPTEHITPSSPSAHGITRTDSASERRRSLNSLLLSRLTSADSEPANSGSESHSQSLPEFRRVLRRSDSESRRRQSLNMLLLSRLYVGPEPAGEERREQ
jgi:hypothetical protein